MMLAEIETPRVALQRLIDERREDYAALSRLLGATRPTFSSISSAVRPSICAKKTGGCLPPISA